jgi:cytochrome c
MQKSLWIVSTGILFSSMLVPAAGRWAQDTPPAPAAPAATNPVKPTADSQAKAAKLYADDCAFCHGANGNGKTDLATAMQLTLPDMTNPTAMADKTDAELFTIIRKGKDKMPAEDTNRVKKDDDIWNLVIYLRNLSRPGTAKP